MVKIGPAFGDYIRLEKSQRHLSRFGKDYSIRSYLLPFILIIAVGLILVRLFFLQIIKGSDYRLLSDANRTKTIAIHAPRGIIFDRDGIPLVFNVPGFRQTLNDPLRSEASKTRLLDKNEALKLISAGKSNLEIDSLRNYPYKEAFSHVLGYIGQISKEELTRLQSPEATADGGQEQKEFTRLDPSGQAGYKGGDLIGKIGIEREYEGKLAGINGKELVEIDNIGKVIRSLGQTDPIPGQNITLTIDVALQEASFEAGKDIEKGAIIVSSPKGEILALISKPSFDPNLFTMNEGYSAAESFYKSVSQVLSDQENQPLLNRAIGGTYPPGSTFKLITAAAGLEGKVIDENFSVEDTGILRVGDFSFGNWYFTQYGKTEEGRVNIVRGIKRSNDIFFYKLAELVGVDDLSRFAVKFGLGNKLGIDLFGEEEGAVPSPDWKKRIIGEAWYLGDTYHYGIGQGFLLTTPLQVNTWTQAIANGGVIYKPHILAGTTNVKTKKFLSGETVALIKQGMIESCSTGGVAWPLFEFKVKSKKLKVDQELKIACKTGTAQHGGEKDLPHAWITLFAPAQKPEIIVTILSESSGEGSNIAAPIAKKILEEWFSR